MQQVEVGKFNQVGVQATSDRRIVLFDLSIRGHHPNYIQQLIYYWHRYQIAGQLVVVVSPQFLEEHQDVVAQTTSLGRRDLQFVAITPAEEAALKPRSSFLSRTQRAFQEWNLLCKYAAIAKADHCLVMYFDTYQIPLAVGMRAPCPVSGIYFRPTFHYGELIASSPLSWKERLQQQREQFILSRVLSHPQYHRLFCLDPFAAKAFQTRGIKQAVHLPDPVILPEPSTVDPARLKAQLGIAPERQVFLLFGALTGRKGIYQLLDAVAMLSPELSQQFCLLLVGEIKTADRPRVAAQIAAIQQALPVQIVTHYQFVPDEEMQSYFQLADVVLAPYQQHVGMSGILLLAAAAHKPVLSSDYGLMGEMVRRYGLGVAVNATSPEAIAQGLTHCLTIPNQQLGDRQKMHDFATQNSAEEYARIIFQNL